MNAVILLNKPAGMTSFKAVSECRHILQEKKSGHTGTLDPNATGLLIVLLGRYTKLTPYCVHDHKRYHAEFITGIRTDTEDVWGETLEEKDSHPHSEEELAALSASFIGSSSQIPPMYSAIKVNGQKLYELARKGREVERRPRPIYIDSLEVHALGNNRYSMDATVSGGTYIRTLITDYCAKMNEIGAMSLLERRGIESLWLDEAGTLDTLISGRGFTDPLKVIDPAWKQVDGTPYEADIRNGKKIQMECESEQVMFIKDHDVLAAYIKKEDGLYHCQRGLF